ncbi:threonine synthase-like 2 isoform X1 [Pomacea canaliculata]|nr:threonine synthase-like 2 isoform X1 [Pomacea canaliculata]XP_025096226.1 threonine synthase-like 2 isoform X1 [Pomacea canaliculata]
MKYCSTRGKVSGLSFEDVLFSGYLADGGMALPEVIPEVPSETLKSWVGLSYKELVQKIVPLYVSQEELPLVVLEELVGQALSTFDVPEIIPIVCFPGGLNIMELFHGQTWAFKDLAMSILGQFFNFFLNKRQKHLMLVVGTSGDTGSSAIAAVRGLKWVDIVVVLPRDRCTLIQELQMTTVKEDNVFVFRADGSSDDLDVPIREIFDDADFVKKHHLCSANSLNWARIMVQIVHFFYAYIKLCPECDQELEIVVPTGGAGNITAGFIAHKMGLPVKLVCVANSNDGIAQMVGSGFYKLSNVKPSLAPAMDIKFAYNIERLWYLCSERNSELVRKMMEEVEMEGKVETPDSILEELQMVLSAYGADDEDIKRTLRQCWEENHYLLCPHSATAVAYYYKKQASVHNLSQLSVCFATASPLKFGEALTAAGLKPISTEAIQKLMQLPTQYVDMELTDDWKAMLREKVEEMTASFNLRNKQ